MLHGAAARAAGVFSVLLCLWIGGVGQAGHVLKTHDIDFEAPVHTLGEPVSWGGDWPPVKRPASNTESMLTVVEGLDGQACQMVPGTVFFLGEWYVYFTSTPYSFTFLSQIVEMDLQIEALTDQWECLGVRFSPTGEIRHGGKTIGQFHFGERFHFCVSRTNTTAEIIFNGTVLFAGPATFWLSDLQLFKLQSPDSRVLIDNIQAFLETAEPILVFIDHYLGCGVEAGSTYSVNWCASDDVDSVKLEYSRDYGESWDTIEVIENAQGFEWSVPQEPSDFSRLRISDTGTGASREVPFRIYETSPALPEYERIDLVDLLNLPDHSSFYQINDRGSITGFYSDGFVPLKFFVIIEGSLCPISFKPDDLNNLNQVVGIKQINGQDFCMLWEDGQERPLFCLDEDPAASGSYSSVRINDNMEVAAVIDYPDKHDEFIFWFDQQVVYRGWLGYFDRFVDFEINNSGFIAGSGILTYSYSSTDTTALFQFENGQLHVYKIEPICPGLQTFYMQDLNNSGVILCSGAEYNDETADLFLKDGKAVFVSGEQFSSSMGGLRCLNDQGYAAGSDLLIMSTGDPIAVPYLYNKSELVKLDDLITIDSQRELHPVDINNHNYILVTNSSFSRGRGVLAPIQPEQEVVTVSQTLAESIRFGEEFSFKVVAIYDDGLPRDYTERAEIVFEPNGVLSAENGLLRMAQAPATDVTVTATVTCRHGGTEASEVQNILVYAPRELRVPAEYGTIREAIQAARTGDSVVLADGIYTGAGNRDLYCGGRAITVRSENGPEGCVIDCGGSAEEPHFGIDFYDIYSGTFILEGVTIRNGYHTSRPIVSSEATKSVIRNCIFTDNNPASYVLTFDPPYVGFPFGVDIPQTAAVLQDCRFIRSGGVKVGGYQVGIGDDFTAYDVQIECTGCLFEDNVNLPDEVLRLWNKDTCIIRDCIFRNNASRDTVETIRVSGDQVLIEDSLFEGNRARESESVILVDGMICTIERCRFAENHIVHSGSGHLLAVNGESRLSQCLFEGNDCGNGATVCFAPENTEMTAEMENCTLVGNRCGTVSSVEVDGGPVRIENCILRNGGNELRPGAPAVVLYSNVEGGWEGVGNLDVDPLFVREGYWDLNGTPGVLEDDAWVSGDYHLQSEGWRWDAARGEWTWDEATSLCVDAGCPGDGLGEEPTAVAADPLGRWGANVRIDMGCYGGTVEAGVAPPGWRRLSDVTNDWRTDADDLAVLAEQWLEAAAGLGADLDRSGGVGLGDLAVMAGEWGLGM